MIALDLLSIASGLYLSTLQISKIVAGNYSDGTIALTCIYTSLTVLFCLSAYFNYREDR